MYKRALVPVDGSAVGETILPFILAIAGPLDMEVVLLRVVAPVPPMVIEAPRQIIEDAVQERQVDAEEYLAALAVELRNKGLRVETRLRLGAPAAEIVAGARETAADLIAMTTHGRSGLSRLMFGSVAEAVLRHSSIPVFLFRATPADVERRAAREAVP